MALEDRDIDRLKEMFVTRKECNTVNEEINKKLSNDNTKLALIEQKVGQINWVSKTTLAAVISALVAYVLNLILH